MHRVRHAGHFVETLENRVLLATVPAGFVDQPWGGTFGSGTQMEFTPDGRLFVLTQTGSVRVIDTSGTLLATPALSLTVDSFFERGLLGIAFDPSFNANQPGTDYVYLYYTVPAAAGGPNNRIARFEVTGNTINAATQTTILNLNTLSAGNHNGGGMHFGPDGMLYVGVGENAVSSNSQSISNLLGKILRINPDPLNPIPTDNPTSFPGIAGSPTGNNRAIWAVGLRNPFTSTFHPVTGKFMINDVGQNTWEEANDGIAGRNYGWPSTEGDFNPASFPNFTRPLYYYQHGSGLQRGNTIAGGAFYSSNAATQFPPQYQGKYFFGDYVNDWIAYVDPAAPPTVNTHTNFASSATDVVDLKVGPDGSLYYLQGGASGNGVRRIKPDPSTAPSILNQPQNQNKFNGEDATFTVVAGGQGTLTYKWQRNGVDIPGTNSPTYTLTNVQPGDSGAVFRCVVTNNIGTAISNGATLTVTVDAPPVPVINTPTASTMYTAGDTINFSGTVTDPDEPSIPLSGYTWRVDFHHGGHTHPFMAPTAGIDSGSFVIPTTGETAADVWYRIYLTGTDALGRQATVFRDVNPNTSTITVNTAGIASGAVINIDGQPTAMPSSFLGVAGIIRNLDAPLSQTVGGQTYNFVSWSDAGAANHNITTQLVDTTYTATYLDVTAPLVNGSSFVYDQFNLPLPPHRVDFVFSEDVSASLTLADFVAEDLDNSVVIPSGSLALFYNTVTNTASVTFPGFPDGVLPDGDYRVTLLGGGVTDSVGNVLASGTAATFFAFAADANHDRSVNSADFNILATNFGSSGRTFGQGNFSYDSGGLVNSADFNILAVRFGSTLAGSASRGASLPGGSGSGGNSSLFSGNGRIGDDDDLLA